MNPTETYESLRYFRTAARLAAVIETYVGGRFDDNLAEALRWLRERPAAARAVLEAERTSP